MTFQEIQEKLKKCELALTSIKDGSYSNSKYSKQEALEKFNTIKESLEKKLNLLKEEETMFVSTKGGDTKAVSMDTKAAMDLKKDPNITGITTAKGKDLKEDDLSDEEQEEVTTETSHTEVVAKEVHKAFIDALQDTGHEVSDHNISSLNPETFTLTVKFKDNTQSDYSFEFDRNEVKLDGNIIVTTSKKGVTPILNKTIAKDNSVKYLKNLTEKKGKDHDGDGDIDSDDYLLARDKAIKANMKKEETEFEVDAKGKPTGNLKLKLSDKDRETLKKIEDLLSKEKNETKGAPKGHYFTKSGNLVKGRLTKDARERGARLSDPKDKQRSKIPPVTQYNEGEGGKPERIVVPGSQLKDALEIVAKNIDGNYVKVTSGSNISGNGIIKFHFDPSYSDAEAFMYDTVMDLVAQDINVQNSTKYIDEALDHNDPVLMRSRIAKMRADDMKKLDALKKANIGPSRKEKQAREVVRKLKIKRAEIESEMENDPDIEPTGGPVADMYGDQLNKIDNAIEKAASVYNKPMDYDTAVGKVTEEDKMKEHIAIGHPDNEPGMLKQDVHDIAHYAVKLYKLLKYYESLEDQVDFPHWWQSKVVKAREYISKAAHYLEFKTNEPAIDAQVGALQEDEEPTKADMAKEKSLAKKAALLQFIASMQKKGILDKDKKVLDKDAYKKELDAFKKNVKEGRNLNELSGDQTDALYELQNILDDIAQKGEEAREIIRQSFPRMLSKADAYGAFDLGSSSNRYDTTLASIIEEIEEYYDEEEDLDEIGMFHDPIGYSSTAAAEDKRALQFVKDLINKGVNKEDAIEKAAEKFNLRVHYLTRYVDKLIDEAVTHDFEERIDQIVNHYFKGDQEVKKAAVEYASIKGARVMGGRSATASLFKDFYNSYSDEVANQAMEVIDMADDDVYQEGKYKSDAQRKAIHAKKAELKEEMDGGRLFDYFNSKGYDITERRPDGYPPKEGVVGYQVSRGNDRYPQSVIFQYNTNNNEFTISRMSGYRIDQKQAIKAGMREAGRSGAAGMDSYMTNGNYTPVGISAEGLKDIVDHVMTGLDREGQAQRDFYKDRGPTSGTIDEGATCCGRCGRVHVKGSGCKRPYLKGKSHCRNK